MAYTMEDFRREVAERELAELAELSVEQRIEGLGVDEILQKLDFKSVESFVENQKAKKRAKPIRKRKS